MQETDGFPVSAAAPALAVRLQSAGPEAGLGKAYGLGTGRYPAVAPGCSLRDRHRERRHGRTPRPPALRGWRRVNAGVRHAIWAEGTERMVATELAASGPGRSRHPLAGADRHAARDASADGARRRGALDRRHPLPAFPPGASAPSGRAALSPRAPP